MNKILKYNKHQYLIPIVCKDKDYLVSYMYGFYKSLEFMSIIDESGDELLFEPKPNGYGLDSSRFNDIYDDKGSRTRNLTDRQAQKYIDDKLREHEEKERINERLNNGENILGTEENFLQVECLHCGNFYSFRLPEDVPEKNLTCGICGRIIIDYTGHWDYEYTFDG